MNESAKWVEQHWRDNLRFDTVSQRYYYKNNPCPEDDNKIKWIKMVRSMTPNPPMGHTYWPLKESKFAMDYIWEDLWSYNV